MSKNNVESKDEEHLRFFNLNNVYVFTFIVYN